METREIPEETAHRFAGVAEALAGRGVSVTKMFVTPGLKFEGKLFAGVFGDGLTFKEKMPKRRPLADMLPAEIDRERPGFFLRSAVLADVHNDMQVAKEEIFGPVACILSFETEEEAVCMANDSPRARWLRS